MVLQNSGPPQIAVESLKLLLDTAVPSGIIKDLVILQACILSMQYAVQILVC